MMEFVVKLEASSNLAGRESVTQDLMGLDLHPGYCSSETAMGTNDNVFELDFVCLLSGSSVSTILGH
jgi:hypothetical protein